MTLAPIYYLVDHNYQVDGVFDAPTPPPRVGRTAVAAFTCRRVLDVVCQRNGEFRLQTTSRLDAGTALIMMEDHIKCVAKQLGRRIVWFRFTVI